MLECKRTCEFCEKLGLPILPVRYAIAPDEATAPRLSAPMKVDDGRGAEIPLGGKAHYTTRLLRSGYLYVYDEARKRWEGYFITPEGFSMRFDVDKPMPSGYGKGRVPCSDSGHREAASCITITSPKLATKIWLAFSDVEWTPAVMSLHQDSAFRQRHMRAFDVKAWLDTVRAEHAQPISKLASTVAEYVAPLWPYAIDAKRRVSTNDWLGLSGSSPADGALAAAMAYSTAPWQPRHQLTESTISLAQRMNPGKGVIIALSDPAGMVMDLAGLMKHREHTFMSQGDRRYHSTVDGWLSEIEAQIKNDAQRGRQDAVADERDYRRGPMAPTLFPATRIAYHSATSDSLAQADSAAQLDAVANEAWKRYGKKLRPSERQAWRNKIAQDAAVFDREQIAPLADAHVKWFQSSLFKHYTECVFDPRDIHSGFAFTGLISACVLATDDKRQCQALYTTWLSESISTPNPLLKALAYNQKTLLRDLGGAANSVSYEQLPWDKLIEGFDKAVGSVAEGTPDILGRLVAALPGSVTATLKRAASSPRTHSALVAIGVASRQPVVRVTVTGGKKAFRAALIRQMLRAHGRAMDMNQIQRAVAAELRRLEVYGVPLRGTDSRQWLLIVDPAHVRNMPAGLTAQGRAQWLAASIRTPEDVEALELHRFQQKVARAESNVRSATFFTASFAFAALGIYANYVALFSILEDEKKAMTHVASETLTRVWAQASQLVGAVAAALETGVQKLTSSALRAANGVLKALELGAKWVKWGFGFGGAILMSMIDFWRSGQEFREGNYSGGVMYLVSGMLGIAATVLLSMGWTGLGVLAALAMIGWAFVMTHWVDDKLQDWLERCVWGDLAEQRYGSFDTEKAELDKAMPA